MQRNRALYSCVVVILASLFINPGAFAADNGKLQAEIQALQVAVANLQSSVAALQTSNTQLASQVALDRANFIHQFQLLQGTQVDQMMQINTLQSNTVLTLNHRLGLNADRVTAQFTHVNVQIVNGEGSTDTVDGTGNLILGYNEPNTTQSQLAVCSDGAYAVQTTCTAAGATWGPNQHTGSHNLVTGMGQSYTQYGGLIAGFSNGITAPAAVVIGGEHNVGRGQNSTVTGGYFNASVGRDSTVSSGTGNFANGDFSGVTGGGNNSANGVTSSISGGHLGTTSGYFSSVCGGDRNQASADYSSVNGGLSNTAAGLRSTVSGGANRSVTGTTNWEAGALFQSQ